MARTIHTTLRDELFALAAAQGADDDYLHHLRTAPFNRATFAARLAWHRREAAPDES